MAGPIIESITDGHETLALIIRRHVGPMPPGARFCTEDQAVQQLAFMAHPRGHRIPPHVHKPVARTVHSTPECIIMQRGLIRVDFYRRDRAFVTNRTLEAGDVLLLVGGGHGFTMLDDAEFIEVKQGPYLGIDADKLRFDPG